MQEKWIYVPSKSKGKRVGGLEILKWALRQDRSGDTEKEGKRHSTPTFQGHFVSEGFVQSGETDSPPRVNA